MESLENQLEKNLTQTEKRIEVLKSKFFLTDVCFEKAIDILAQLLGKGATVEPHKNLVAVFNNLRNQICTSYVTMSQMQSAVAQDLTSVKESYEQAIKDRDTQLKEKEGNAYAAEQRVRETQM